MSKLLSISEMAERLGFSAKTFAKYVCELKIPHIVLGSRKRFDPCVVEAFLVPVPKEEKPSNVVQIKPNVKRQHKQKSNAFAESIGL